MIKTVFLNYRDRRAGVKARSAPAFMILTGLPSGGLLNAPQITARAGGFVAGFLTLASTGFANEYRVSPVVHENLAIYIFYGKSTAGPLPLEEALAMRTVQVHENSNVNVKWENLSSRFAISL
jgi:hypothetical protein